MSGLTFDEWEVLRGAALTNAVTILLTGLLIWSAFRLRAWYREDTGPADDRHELLVLFKDMQQQGDLTDEEYRSIKGRLSGDAADDSAPASGEPSGPSPGQDEPAAGEPRGASQQQNETRTDAPSGMDAEVGPSDEISDGCDGQEN